MTALNGRRAGRRQPSKIDPTPAANDAPEPDDPASAEALAARLYQSNGVISENYPLL